jgi:2,3-bisphosphoglycerate-independent phosphoglycerate mutase
MKKIKKVLNKILSLGGSAIVTADHGNADKMVGEDGEVFTAHTTNPVPFIIVSEKFKNVKLANDGKLCDIAPTLLDMMNLSIPAEMTGKSLIQK